MALELKNKEIFVKGSSSLLLLCLSSLSSYSYSLGGEGMS